MNKDMVTVSNSNTPAPLAIVAGFSVPSPTQPNDKVEFAITQTGRFATVKARTAEEDSTVVIPQKKDGTVGKAYKVTKQKK